MTNLEKLRSHLANFLNRGWEENTGEKVVLALINYLLKEMGEKLLIASLAKLVDDASTTDLCKNITMGLK